MGIGGYISGDGYAKFTSTANLRKMSEAAIKHFKTDNCKVAVPEVEAFLKTLGKRGQGVLKNLPKNGLVEFLSSHGAMQLIAGDKNIIKTCEKLKNPIMDFARTVPKRLLSLLKMVK